MKTKKMNIKNVFININVMCIYKYACEHDTHVGLSMKNNQANEWIKIHKFTMRFLHTNKLH